MIWTVHEELDFGDGLGVDQSVQDWVRVVAAVASREQEVEGPHIEPMIPQETEQCVREDDHAHANTE
jgi:hypothetical protein